LTRARLLFWIAVVPALAQANERGQLDSNPAVFGVMAALHAAGYDLDAASPANHPVRKALFEYLAQQPLSVREELKSFLTQHRQKDPGAEFSQYVSYALTLAGPPEFGYRYPNQGLPPDAASLEGLNKLVARLWVEANLGAIWRQLQPAYEQVIAQYHEPVTAAVMQVNAYLRNPTSGAARRNFQIYVELAAPPNQIHTRSYGDDYLVLVTPTPELPIDEVRRAYLNYLLDPLSIRHGELVAKKAGLLDLAQGAPALPAFYKQDFSLLMTASLVKAVEARLAPPNRREVMVDQAMREGYIVTAAIYDQLPAYEKQEASLRIYYPELVKGIDLGKEDKRIARVEFAAERAARVVRVTPAERPVELTGPARMLDEAEKRYNEKAYPQAKELFLRLLKETDQRPFHAKAYFGLARIAALDRDPESSDRLFRKVLELDPEPDVRAWSLLYLGRLADAQGNREEARQHYEAALKVTGVPPRVKAAAEQGLKEAFQKQ
jgi:tetratricopeptide (TPR) repeat protein